MAAGNSGKGPNRKPQGRPGQNRPGQRPGQRPPQKGKTVVGGKKVSAPGGSRLSPTTIGLGAVAIVVVVALVIVIVKVATSPSTPSTGGIDGNIAAPSSMVQAATGVSLAEMDKVGELSSSVIAPPTVEHGHSLLKADGKPAVVFVGAEYCPYCAAERWAIVAALSKFGTFSNLGETNSSETDVFPGTPTFSFHGSSYSSPYISFQAVEEYSNQPSGSSSTSGSAYQSLDAPNAVESGAWTRFNSQGYPFLDFGDQIVINNPTYNPGVLHIPPVDGTAPPGITDASAEQAPAVGLNTITGALTDTKSPITQAILASANYIAASICDITKQKPANVCSASGVIAAAKAMKLT